MSISLKNRLEEKKQEKVIRARFFLLMVGVIMLVATVLQSQSVDFLDLLSALAFLGLGVFSFKHPSPAFQIGFVLAIIFLILNFLFSSILRTTLMGLAVSALYYGIQAVKEEPEPSTELLDDIDL